MNNREIIDMLPLKWTAPKSVNTRYGPRLLRKATIERDSKFWPLWKSHKAAIKACGIGVHKEENVGWRAHWWENPEEGEGVAQQSAAPAPAPAPRIDIAKPVQMMPKPAAPPKGLSYLPYQEKGILFHRGRSRTLIADEMGLGKTVQALGIINDSMKHGQSLDSYNQVLVVCPSSLKFNWRAEAKKWVNKLVSVRVVEGLKDTLKPWGYARDGEVSMVIVNYEVLHAYEDQLKKGMFDLVVFDEAQYIKSKDAIRTRMARLLWAKRPEQHLLFLTGTPIVNRPEEIYTVYEACSEKRRTWTDFTDRFCNAYQDRWGRHTHGASNLGQLHEEMKPFMVRRKKKDVLTQLPPKVRSVIPLGIPTGIGKQAVAMSKEYEELHAELNKLAKKSGGLQGGEGLNQLAKLRKNLADLKVDAAVQHIKDVLQSVDKVLVFCHHRSVAGQLNCRLSRHQPAMINGDTPPKVRHEAVRRFQDQKGCRVFIGNLQAAGVGLTLTAASAVIFVESDWSPSQNLQCEDRAHRIGQKDTVLVHYLVLPGTLEERMAKACARKMVISSEVVDGGA